MNKEMARLKLRNSSMRSLAGSGVRERETETILSVNIKRLEEKNRIKDNKIDELKQTIFVLEETIMKLRKKQTQIVELQEMIDRLEKTNRNLNEELSKTKK